MSGAITGASWTIDNGVVVATVSGTEPGDVTYSAVELEDETKRVKERHPKRYVVQFPEAELEGKTPKQVLAVIYKHARDEHPLT